MPFRFEGLKIWHQAREFSDEVYRLVAGFPDHERYSLTSQMTRAANSISLNIAEGSGRDTDMDFNRFLGIAIGSAFEVVSASYLALDRGYVDPKAQNVLYE
jgi:four helix bundle protein